MARNEENMAKPKITRGRGKKMPTQGLGMEDYGAKKCRVPSAEPPLTVGCPAFERWINKAVKEGVQNATAEVRAMETDCEIIRKVKEYFRNRFEECL